ncbi:NAD(P)/FAD-dependent oxidoreductase [Komagataeibacter xylinus]|uniref:NAD(P)/FAD-dependent oxidoreductase n=1 Tax=Komagataeibacter xylinus TaxID=28448 RepID=UPI00280C1A9A|nr:NAD(P)/FAD-dependent oxidoreductase [Komagataeibacter xylinus]
MHDTAHKPASPSGLPALEARLRQDMEWLQIPAKEWVPPRTVDGERIWDVVVIGGGMAGITASAMLKRYGIHNQVVLDRAPAGREGPWITYARMETLRSPKDLTGPAMGLPALTFRAWYEARFGLEAWRALDKIPRAMWMEYLVWVRKVLELPVRNDTTVKMIDAGNPDYVRLTITTGTGEETMLARRVVLANGRDGMGGAYIPAIARTIPKRYWAHSMENIDFAALKGKRVAVIGGGASAMDNAATALETGCGRLDMFVRRPDFPRVHKFNGIGSQGVVHGFAGLPDEWKWRFLDYTLSAQTPPPRASVLRVSRHANAHFHLGSPIRTLAEEGGHVRLTTPKGTYDEDFIIFATGFWVDIKSRPELEKIAPFIRFWGERFVPPADGSLEGKADMELKASPDLAPDFSFQENVPGACPGLKHVYCFTFPATLSHGKVSGDIPAISDGADRLARGVVRSLFVEDRAIHFENLRNFAVPDLQGDEWTDADAPVTETAAMGSS